MDSIKKTIVVAILSALAIGCSHLERSPQSGYSGLKYRQQPTYHDIISSRDPSSIPRLAAELGLNSHEINSPEGANKIRQALEIRSLEALLTDEREKRQYYQHYPWFKDDEERLDFLKQNGYFARLSWLRRNKIGRRAVEIDSKTEELVTNKDIALGMPKEIVKLSWGTPDAQGTAGNPVYGKELWRYKRLTPSANGYKLQTRLVYFEGGKVVGWEQIEH